MTPELEDSVRKIVELLVAGKYDHVADLTGGHRLDSATIRHAIIGYGKALVLPPRDAFRNVDAVAVKNTTPQQWSVWMPLWTAEEGRSDLTIELTQTKTETGFDIELDNIRVP